MDIGRNMAVRASTFAKQYRSIMPSVVWLRNRRSFRPSPFKFIPTLYQSELSHERAIIFSSNLNIILNKVYSASGLVKRELLLRLGVVILVLESNHLAYYWYHTSDRWSLLCTASFANASAPALITFTSRCVRRSMMSGMGRVPVADSRNSATYINIQIRKFDTLPCSESFAKVITPTSQTSKFQDLGRILICGMAGHKWISKLLIVDQQCFRKENLTYYFSLRVSTVHLHLPYEYSNLYARGG